MKRKFVKILALLMTVCVSGAVSACTKGDESQKTVGNAESEVMESSVGIQSDISAVSSEVSENSSGKTDNASDVSEATQTETFNNNVQSSTQNVVGQDSAASVSKQTSTDFSSKTNNTVSQSGSESEISDDNENGDVVDIERLGGCGTSDDTFQYGKIVSEGMCGDTVKYQLHESGVMIISGNGAMYHYDESGEGNIESEAERPWSDFYDDIIAVAIEDGVTSIGSYAFSSLPQLREVYIADSVSGNMGIRTFYNCPELKSIRISENIKVISGNVFEGCAGLEEISIPDGVEFIGYYVFKDCVNLRKITIPESVNEISLYGQDGHLFSGCSSLEEIEVSEKNAVYASDDGILYNKDKTELLFYPQNKSGAVYEIQPEVKEICGWAFCDSCNLETITIPETVVNIGYAAFHGWTSEQMIIFEGIDPSLKDWADDWSAFCDADSMWDTE